MSYITYAGVEIECDVCGVSLWIYEQPTTKDLIKNAEENALNIGGWVTENDQHICPDCQDELREHEG